MTNSPFAALLASFTTAMLVLLSCSAPPAPDPPAPETSTMEPAVAAKIEEARRRVHEHPQSAEAWGRLGMIFQAHALYGEAVDCYREALAKAPRDERWPYLAALAQQKVERPGALPFFEAAARLTPQNPALYVHYGNALLELGENGDAQRQYEEALRIDSASTHALYGLGQIELAAGKVDAALAHLKAAAELAPHHGEVHALLAQVYQRRGESEAARAAELRARAFPATSRPADPIAEAMEDQAVSSRSYTQRGVRLARLEQFAEAEAAFRRVLEIRPGSARDYANLGGALARQGKLDEAVNAYRKALELEPGEASSRNNLAMALVEKGRLEEAAGQLEEAVRLDASYVEALNNLGLVRFRQKRFSEAADHYRAAIALDPSHTDSHLQLGTVLAAEGRLEEAIVHWRQALAIDPREMSALYNLSVALSQTGKHKESIEALESGLRLAPNSSRLVSLLAWELATAPEDELRDGARAAQLARRIYDAYPDQPTSADVFAAALAEAGDFAEAVRIARRGLERARASRQTRLVRQLEERLARYLKQQPYRQP